MQTGLTEAAFEDSAVLGAPASISASPWVAMKFGGTSVATAKRWQTIARLVRARLDEGKAFKAGHLEDPDLEGGGERAHRGTVRCG